MIAQITTLILYICLIFFLFHLLSKKEEGKTIEEIFSNISSYVKVKLGLYRFIEDYSILLNSEYPTIKEQSNRLILNYFKSLEKIDQEIFLRCSSEFKELHNTIVAKLSILKEEEQKLSLKSDEELKEFLKGLTEKIKNIDLY